MLRKNKEDGIKMKIGIMTFWMSNDNYGQQLQSYALQQFLKKQGHQPFLIRHGRQELTLYLDEMPRRYERLGVL